MFFQAVIERFYWAANGLLVVLYFSFDHLLALLLLASTLLYAYRAVREQRAWALAVSVLAFAASLFTPAPVPLFLVVMSAAGWAAVWLEQFSRLAARWSTVKALGLYALLGLGFAFYRASGMAEASAADPLTAQGMTYVNALIGIAMYVFPIGFLAYTAQTVFAHPPQPGGSPEALIRHVRSRNTGR